MQSGYEKGEKAAIDEKADVYSMGRVLEYLDVGSHWRYISAHMTRLHPFHRPDVLFIRARIEEYDVGALTRFSICVRMRSLAESLLGLCEHHRTFLTHRMPRLQA